MWGWHCVANGFLMSTAASAPGMTQFRKRKPARLPVTESLEDSESESVKVQLFNTFMRITRSIYHFHHF